VTYIFHKSSLKYCRQFSHGHNQLSRPLTNHKPILYFSGLLKSKISWNLECECNSNNNSCILHSGEEVNVCLGNVAT